MSERESDLINIENCPIITVDGTYMHFLDDYVSLILYQNRVIPHKDDKNMKPTLKREIVMDARLSIPTLQHIMMVTEDGLKIHRMSKMMSGHHSFWGDTTFADEPITVEKTAQSADEIPEDRALGGFFFDTFQTVNDNGRKRIFELLTDFISDHLSEIKDIREQYGIEEAKDSVK